MKRETKKVGRYREGAETRERILDTALDLIASNGYSATSIAKISKAAGVQPASLYWAFGSKEGLLAAVIERAADQWFATAANTAKTGNQNDLWGVIQNWATHISKRPEFLRLLLVLSLERREGDDRVTGWAFDSQKHPFGSRLNAIYGSDLGHWDLLDMRDAAAEAYELVEEGVISGEDFRNFVFVNPVKFVTALNPDFFKGTVVEQEVGNLLGKSVT